MVAWFNALLGALCGLVVIGIGDAKAEAWRPEQTWSVVASVTTWGDPELEDFDTRRRLDLVLDRALGERGVPESQRRLLTDGDASAGLVVEALEKQVAAAPPGSTFVFYFQGHGIFDDDHRFVMTTTETDSDDLGRTGLKLEQVLAAYLGRDHRDRVILLGDACYSGHLANVAIVLSHFGIPALALTSADAKSESSENWTFTQAVLDALGGRFLVDRDSDATIRLGELADEARLAMRYREGQPIGFFRPARGFVELELGPSNGIDHPSAGPRLVETDAKGEVFGRGDWIIATRLGGERGVARVLGAGREEGKPTRLRVEYYDFSERAFAWTREDQADPIVFERWPVGIHLNVLDDDEAARAIVLASSDGLHLVHYVDYPPTEDEWVTPDQIIGPWEDHLEREKVLVVDGSTLHEAVVKGPFGDKLCVRYRGSSWLEDECLLPSRLRRSDPPPIRITPAPATLTPP